jgi:hypothetical protein
VTRRDYVAVAGVMARLRPRLNDTVAERRLWAQIVQALADVMEQGNPRFDRERFRLECERRPT